VVRASRMKSALQAGRLVPLFLLFGALKHIIPVQHLARLAWRPPADSAGPEVRDRIASTVLRVGALAGWPDRDCLQRSLLLYRELSRLGAEPELVVGFRKDEERVTGHAWVRAGGRPIAEDEADLCAFVPTLRFGSHGQLLGPASEPPA
jgi:hypothetical protein